MTTVGLAAHVHTGRGFIGNKGIIELEPQTTSLGKIDASMPNYYMEISLQEEGILVLQL